MNTNTNELMALNNDDIVNITEDFTEVPKHLQGEAAKLLDGEKEVQVPFESKSPLAKWANKVREKQAEGFQKELKMAIRVKNQQKR